ncbi:MAG: hypothetical protein LBQ70_07480 [Prevotellaceae bacterium]|jgi:hypothetical protein|nr:hypothetical protein [Prevotellaceae bacterium]
MIPTHNDMRILFEGKPEEYIDLYREELDEFLKPDEEDELREFEDFSDVESLDAEELFEILFTIPMTTDDDYCEVVNILADEYLPYDIDADYENKKLVVYIDEDKYVIDSQDGYSILRKFDEIIKPEFEIRVMKLSLDEDNVHSLVILKSDDWKDLEIKYADKVAAYFETIDKTDFKR